jgi:hypothetical protein
MKPMKNGNFLYLITLATVFISRLSVIISPNTDTVIFGTIIHHFWYGFIFIILGLLVPVPKKLLKTLFYGIGLGLVIDQLFFMLLGAGGDYEYWKLASLVGPIIILFIFFFFRNKTTELLTKYF